MALQILNMSVSGRITDDNIPFVMVNDSVNIADHALEFVVENMLGFTNAFPEKKELKERHSATCCQKIQIITLYSYQPSIATHYHFGMRADYLPFLVSIYNSHPLEIAAPPPKTA